MRRIAFLMVMTVNYIVGMPILLVVAIVSLINRPLSNRMAYQFNRFTGLLMLWVSGAKIHAEGLENMSIGRNCLYIANHRSMFDIPVMAKYLKKYVMFIGKDSVAKWPLLGWWMHFQGTLFIDRKSPKAGMQAIRTGIEAMKNGHSMVIFPEGTRSKGPEMLPFKKGSIRIAEKANVPIIPCAIKGTFDVFERNGFNLKAENIFFRAGEPIYLDQIELAPDQTINDYVHDVISEMYQKLG